MSDKMEVEVFYPKSLLAWRKWLEKNHLSKQAVWLVFYTKASNKFSLSWSESVEIALCFGWIDSKKIKIDSETSHQFFSKRKANSTWSKINKEKILQLAAKGLMTDAGIKCVEIAKENGSWTLLDEVEELIIPKDLESKFKAKKGSKEYFLSLSKSNKKAILQWVVMAKRPETRLNRINEIVELAAKQQIPKHLP